MYDFCSIKNTVIDSVQGGTGTELDDILETIERQQFVNPEKLLEYFWDMFVGDAFLGNFDRHNGNWGFLYDDKAQTSEIAPVFDCGSRLLPQADENIMKKVLESEEELNSRIFVFLTSAIKLNGTKINYYKFLTAAQYKECNKAVLRIAPKINRSEIEKFIDKDPYITEVQKNFYKKYITSRYELIIKPTFEQMQKNAQALSDTELSIELGGECVQ